jgi:hypothetical protein
MMLPISAALHPSTLALVLALTSPPLSQPPELPVLEVVKVYGKLAGPECYGLKAPPGSSCQVHLQDLEQALSLDATTKLSKDEFAARLEKMNFQWPLKPYGVDKSLSKTAVMNKGGETRVFMEELEKRGLYDRRNPTGPLPTSLRPALNKQLQAEGLDPRAIDLVFRAFSGGKSNGATAAQIEKLFGGKDEMDYYDFLNIVGTESVLWPN